MSTINLSGVTPDNPLGFRAAVGLMALCERMCPGDCRLSWQPMQAVLHTNQPCSADQLVSSLNIDHKKNGCPSWLAWCKDARSPSEQYCEQLKNAAHSHQEGLAALAHEYVTDKKGNLRPTAWRMYGVKERTGWLDSIREVAEVMTAEKWREALFGPWRYEDAVSPLGWDPNVVQHHAEQARSTSATRPLATAGAVWLAVHSLPLFQVFVRWDRGPRLTTTGIRNNAFCWATWSQPATLSTVKLMLRLDYKALTAEQRQALGILQVWRSGLVPVGDRRALQAGALVG